jgi:hypothetical protein
MMLMQQISPGYGRPVIGGRVSAPNPQQAANAEYDRRRAAYMEDKRSRNKGTQELKYPFSVDVAGHGFQNLYDVVGGRKKTPSELKRNK